MNNETLLMALFAILRTLSYVTREPHEVQGATRQGNLDICHFGAE